eukprot:TRINITY_DN776316_c0_g1_i1.p1 TRINITY_DN776316_c0_g1~~TRINITY_DN776316_c0_g1_i1.p1  ORF type:complete len:325 (-),score=56.03 TRINITY_DN776316_c0_g1_i1:114-1088(-)
MSECIAKTDDIVCKDEIVTFNKKQLKKLKSKLIRKMKFKDLPISVHLEDCSCKRKQHIIFDVNKPALANCIVLHDAMQTIADNEKEIDFDFIRETTHSRVCVLAEEECQNGFVLYSGSLQRMSNCMSYFNSILKSVERSSAEKDLAHSVCILSTGALYDESKFRSDFLADFNRMWYPFEILDEEVLNFKFSGTVQGFKQSFKGHLGEDLETDERYHLFVVWRVLNEDGSLKRFRLSIPGGKRNLPESSWQCAVRECYEETGIIINPETKDVDIRLQVDSLKLKSDCVEKEPETKKSTFEDTRHDTKFKVVDEINALSVKVYLLN